MTSTDQAPAPVTTPIHMNRSWKVFFAIATLAVCGWGIQWLTVHGTPGNTIQASVLTGLFFTVWGTLAAIYLGGSLTILVKAFGKGAS